MNIGYLLNYSKYVTTLFALKRNIGVNDEYIHIKQIANYVPISIGDDINVFIKNTLFECIYNNDILIIKSRVLNKGSELCEINMNEDVYVYVSPQKETTNTLITFNNVKESLLDERIRYDSLIYNLKKSNSLKSIYKEKPLTPQYGDVYFNNDTNAYEVYERIMSNTKILKIEKNCIYVLNNENESLPKIIYLDNKILTFKCSITMDNKKHVYESEEELFVNSSSRFYYDKWITSLLPKIILDKFML